MAARWLLLALLAAHAAALPDIIRIGEYLSSLPSPVKRETSLSLSLSFFLSSSFSLSLFSLLSLNPPWRFPSRSFSALLSRSFHFRRQFHPSATRQTTPQRRNCNRYVVFCRGKPGEFRKPGKRRYFATPA